MKSRFTTLCFLSIAIIFLLSCNTLSTYSPTPSPTITSIPTNTSSPVPTSTPTDLPTSTPHPTDSPTPIPNSEIIRNEDDSSIFYDYQDGYQISFPSHWVVIDISNEDLQSLISEGIDGLEPEIADFMAKSIGAVQENMKIFSLNTRTVNIANDTVGNANIMFIEDKMIDSFSLSALLETTISGIKSIFEGFKLFSNETFTNHHDVAIGKIDYQISIINFEESISFFQHQYFVKLENGLFVITFTFFEDSIEIMLEDIEYIIGSIKLN